VQVRRGRGNPPENHKCKNPSAVPGIRPMRPWHALDRRCAAPYTHVLGGGTCVRRRRRGGRVVMQRPAKPCTSVRFRSAPPCRVSPEIWARRKGGRLL